MLNIIYEDKDLLVCHKPAGMLSQGGKSFDVDLVSQVLSERRKKGEPVYAAVINRLDRPVEGLVLLAKNKAQAARLNKQLQDGRFHKIYYAVTCGIPEPEKGILTDYLEKDERRNLSCVCDETNPRGKMAVLEYEVLCRDVKAHRALVKIDLKTGRHHQIRVQFAARSWPIAGDGKYGKADGARQGEIALCACELEIPGKHFEIVPQGMIAEIFGEYFQKQ